MADGSLPASMKTGRFREETLRCTLLPGGRAVGSRNLGRSRCESGLLFLHPARDRLDTRGLALLRDASGIPEKMRRRVPGRRAIGRATWRPGLPPDWNTWPWVAECQASVPPAGHFQER